MRRFRYEYGAGPLHLLVAVASFALAGWALSQAVNLLSSPGHFLIWLLGAAVVHDLILFPLYALLGVLAGGALGARRSEPPSRLRVAALNHLRVPALLSGLALLVFFPVVLDRAGPSFMSASGLSNEVYMQRWLLLTAVLFVGSALLLALRARALRAGS
jgi:hypothetical protein